MFVDKTWSGRILRGRSGIVESGGKARPVVALDKQVHGTGWTDSAVDSVSDLGYR